MTKTMYDLKKDLIKELNDNKQEILENDELIYEFVDSNVPIMNYDLLKLACDDLYLGFPDEEGIIDVDIEKVCSESADNAYDIIKANVYCELMTEAHTWLDLAQEIA